MVDLARATVIAVSWTSTSSLSYDVELTAGGVEVESTNINDTQYSFDELTNGTVYMIRVIPRNQICQGEQVQLEVTAGIIPTGKY